METTSDTVTSPYVAVQITMDDHVGVNLMMTPQTRDAIIAKFVANKGDGECIIGPHVMFCNGKWEERVFAIPLLLVNYIL